MPTIEEFISGRSPLTPAQIYRLRELVADWQLLSDLSFADSSSGYRFERI